MSVDISKLKSRVLGLSNSLDDLESILEPLLSQTLSETVINLEPLQQAKLQTDVPYVLYDLVFMYLKLKGIDPKTHPVISELDRIRQYFEKISNVENPPTRRNEIDKAAAGRFIKHAISSVKWTKTAAEEAQEEPEASSSRVPLKITTKMFERAEHEKRLKEKAAAGEESEEEDLQVFDSEEMQVDSEPASKEPSPQDERKRRRPAIDPFSGYGENAQPSEQNHQSNEPTPPIEPSETPRTKTKKAKSEATTTPKSEASKKKKKSKKKVDS